MAITLQFPATREKKQRNSTKRLPMSSPVEVVLKDEISVFKPVFEIRCQENGQLGGVNIFNIPCCYCSQFSRWYWITDVKHVTTTVFDIYCETDVLATFMNEIRATAAFVEYSASAGSFVQDNRFPRTYVSNLKSASLGMGDFNSTGCFILQAASSKADCNTGLVQAYAVTKTQLKTIAAKLYDPGLIKAITNTFSNPTEALGSCIWIPLKVAKAKSGSGSIVFNDVTLGTGGKAKRNYVKSLGTISPPDLHKGTYYDASGNRVTSWQDYRNFPPYTEYYIYLPGVGLTELPFQEIFGDGMSEPRCQVTINFSIPTGDVLYTISKPPTGGLESVVMTISGRLGVNIPTSAYQTGLSTVLSSAVAVGAAGLTMGLAPQSAPYMLGTAMTAGANAMMSVGKSSMSVSGNLGSWISSISDILKIRVLRIQYGTTDTPWDAASVVGMPLYKHKNLAELTGYVKCKNAFCSCWGSADEQDLINNYLNGEGVILEYE